MSGDQLSARISIFSDLNDGVISRQEWISLAEPDRQRGATQHSIFRRGRPLRQTEETLSIPRKKGHAQRRFIVHRQLMQ